MTYNEKTKCSTEGEIKRLLSLSEYNRYRMELLQFMPFRNQCTQINYYYDTSCFDLYKAGETLRVRRREKTLTLEYKCEKQIEDDVRICKEYTKNMNDIPHQIILKDYFPKLKKRKTCLYTGHLITERTNYGYGNIIISLDKNIYLDVIDYEIEIEIPQDVNYQHVIGLLHLNDKISPGKYHRYMDRYLQKQ